MVSFLNDIPIGFWQAGAAVFVLLAVYLMAQVIYRVLPFLTDLNEDREKVGAERKELYEKQASIFSGLTHELKDAMKMQREVFEGRITLIENERVAEREVFARERIAREEQVAKERGEMQHEIDKLREEVAQLKAQLEAAGSAALGIKPPETDIKPAESKPDANPLAA